MAQNINNKVLSIVIPVYNEQKTIKGVIEKILNLDLSIKKEIVAVDDGSKDETAQILKFFSDDKKINFIQRKRNGGKGAAVRDGIRATQGDYVVIVDADLEYNPEDLRLLLDVVKERDASVVYGTRFVGPRRRTGYFLNTLANKFLTLFTNFLTGLNLSDMESGYKLFKGDLIRSIPLVSNRFEFEPEITCKLARRKIVIHEVPISYNARSYEEGKKIGFRDGITAIITLLKFGLFKHE